MSDIVTLSNHDAVFDDVKHILYSGAPYIIFDLKGVDESSSFYQLYEYSRERFPGRIFTSEEEARSYKPDTPFSEFKLNSDGLIPCIAQDYKTGKVLMLAYMNEESYNKTLETGLMTYWSRSRGKLWTKGEESGHLQHMISLTIDCDKDTILARVDQEGPACHTGNETCFYTPLTGYASGSSNTSAVFEDVYNVIIDRKNNPREGSYTNYLFDAGLDKILKKVGEECTELVVAAKNTDASEIKYEMADFLYHAMVLMAEKGITWEDITDELSRRE